MAKTGIYESPEEKAKFPAEQGYCKVGAKKSIIQEHIGFGMTLFRPCSEERIRDAVKGYQDTHSRRRGRVKARRRNGFKK